MDSISLASVAVRKLERRDDWIGRGIRLITKGKLCRGCRALLTTENDSEAHIIPNALGGRLKPKGILCRDCNSVLDEVADNALIKAFADWPTLLNIPRDRGKNPPKLIETKNGRRVRLSADGSITAMDVTYQVDPIEGGHDVKIAAGDMKTIKQLLQRAKNQFPMLDVALAEQHARTAGIEDDDELKMSLDFSPEAVFGGLITAVWLYLMMKDEGQSMEWDKLLEVIKNMQSHGGTFRYFTIGLPGLAGPEISLGHKIIVRSIPSTGEVIAYFEILGVLKIGGLFAKGSIPSKFFEHIYAYDVGAKLDRSAEFSINAVEFESQDWKSAGYGTADAETLRDHYRNVLTTTMLKLYQERFPKQTSS